MLSTLEALSVSQLPFGVGAIISGLWVRKQTLNADNVPRIPELVSGGAEIWTSCLTHNLSFKRCVPLGCHPDSLARRSVALVIWPFAYTSASFCTTPEVDFENIIDKFGSIKARKVKLKSTPFGLQNV